MAKAAVGKALAGKVSPKLEEALNSAKWEVERAARHAAEVELQKARRDAGKARRDADAALQQARR
eukprot:593535-Lingulodinium_polyedra.AAC.1